MSLRRTSHAVYDTKYHLVWAPKYRKPILKDELREAIKELFRNILESRDCEVEEIEMGEDHVHIFASMPPKYSIGQMVRMLKCISGKEIFRRYPEVQRQLWGGEFWTDGYFASTVGKHGNEDTISKYVKSQGTQYDKLHEDYQLLLF